MLLLCGVAGPARGQWVKLADLPARVGAVHFLDKQLAPSVGFAGTLSGAIYRTSDDGVSWSKTASPLGDEVKDFAFKDALTGWACALGVNTKRNLAKTTDGGKTWTLLPYGGLLTALSYNPTHHLLFLSSWNGPAVRSSDDGATWEPIAVPVAPTSMNGIAWLSDEVSVMTTLTQVYYGTLDGGSNWQPLPNGTGECWQPLALPAQNAFLASCESFKELRRSGDSGKNWQTVFSFGVPITGMVGGDGNRLMLQTISDGFLVSTDLGLSWQNICGPSNVQDTRFYVKGGEVYAGDIVGGIWKNSTGLPNTIEAADILPSSMLHIITHGCQHDSSFFTLRSPSECGLQLDSLTLSDARFHITLPSKLPASIRLNDSLFVSYTPVGDRPETTSVRLQYHVGTHSYDTTIRVIGSPDHHLRTGLDSSHIVFVAQQACTRITDTLYFRPAGCDSLEVLSITFSDPLHFGAQVTLPMTVTSKFTLPITTFADSAGKFSSGVHIHYREHGVIYDTTLNFDLQVLRGSTPFLLPASFDLAGACTGVDTLIILENAPCDSLEIISVTIDDPAIITLKALTLPAFIKPSGGFVLPIHIPTSSAGSHQAVLTIQYKSVHGQQSSKTIITPITIVFSNAPQATTQALDIKLPSACSALDTILTVINTLCDDLLVDSCWLSDSSSFRIVKRIYPVTLHHGDTLRIPLSIDPMHSGLYTSYLRIKLRHGSAILIDSVLLRVFSFNESQRVPFFDSLPIVVPVEACTQKNYSFKITNAFCRTLTIDSVALLHADPSLQLSASTFPRAILSGHSDSMILHSTDPAANNRYDSALIRYGTPGDEHDTIVVLYLHSVPSVILKTDQPVLLSTFCREGSARCVIRNSGDCAFAIDSLSIVQWGKQFSSTGLPVIPVTIAPHDSLVYYVNFDHTLIGDSSATVRVHVANSDVAEFLPVRGSYQKSLAHSGVTLRYAGTTLSRQSFGAPAAVDLELISVDSISSSVGLNSIGVSILIDRDAIGMSSVTPANGWTVKSQNETSTGYSIELTAPEVIGLSAGEVLATVHSKTFIAKRDTISISLGPVQFNPEDSLFAACRLAPLSSGNELTALLNSKCGDALLRDRLNDRLAISHLSIIPNPVVMNGTQATSLTFDLAREQNIRIRIYNVLGVDCYHSSFKPFSKGTNIIPLDLSKLSSGTYYVNIEGSDERHSLRMVVEK
jgi:photosystem II stability/assembly factor-like uncharacterized protein